MRVFMTTGYTLFPSLLSSNEFASYAIPAPSAVFPTLAACIPGHQVAVYDRMARDRLTLSHFRSLVKEADVVAMTIASSNIALNLELNIKLIRLWRPDIPIILGGHHATIFSEQWLDRGVTAVVRGEGELTFSEVITRLSRNEGLSGVAGVSWRSNKGYIHEPDRPLVEDLSELPIPDYRFLDLSAYRCFLPGRGLVATIECGRGCDGGCRFCLVYRMWHGRQRHKPIDRVLEEIERVYRAGVRRFLFAEDGFGHPPEHYIALAHEISKHFPDITFCSFLRADDVSKSPELVDALAGAGLRAAYIGFESPELDELVKLGKHPFSGLTHPQIYRSIYERLACHSILVFGFIIVGADEVSCEVMQSRLETHMQYCDFPLINELRPIPTTPLGIELQETGAVARALFYHDPYIPVIKGHSKLLPVVHRWFRNRMLYHFPRYMLSPDETKRLFFIHLFRESLRKALFSNIQDLYFVFRMLRDPRRLDNPELFINELVSKLTNPKWIARLMSRSRWSQPSRPISWKVV